MSAERCIFCNSLAHGSGHCNSNLNGRRKILDSMWMCMVQPECPDFESFPINELRYIASNYAIYEKAAWPHDHLGNKYNRKYLRQPISLTLSKKRTVRALVDRWAGFAPVRELMSSPPECKDCPICYENMYIYHWSQRTSSWIETCVHTYGAKYETPMVIDKCKHEFCGRCWGAHAEQNKKYDAACGQYFVSCPMCRQKVHIRPDIIQT